MTESGHGSDVQHLRTTETYVDGEFVIDTRATTRGKPVPGLRIEDRGHERRVQVIQCP